MGVTEPTATFSACFGAAFLVWHPTKYAELLKEKIEEHQSNVWLVNTGWTGGSYGVGHRFSLRYTRAIVSAILNGALDNAAYDNDPHFGLAMPRDVPNVPVNLLNPRHAWSDPAAYDATALKLAAMFRQNFQKYADRATPEILAGGPRS
jgi:phosphoenolpyruvate carboxykinase (ATP)